MKIYSNDFAQYVRRIDDLIAAHLANGAEPMMVEVETRKRRFAANLSAARKNGTFDVYIPNGIDGESDEPFEMTYHIDDVRIFLQD